MHSMRMHPIRCMKRTRGWILATENWYVFELSRVTPYN